MKLVAIVLTFNEAVHLRRCLESIREVADRVVVVDCYSTDATPEIAKECGAELVQHSWVNHATQFNWALGQLEPDTEWVMRIDADEYLTPGLVAEIRSALPDFGPKVDGVYCGRRMIFQGRMIRWGGVCPIRVLRLFRYNRGRCEERWTDEHIKVSGPTANLCGCIVDDNLSSLTWWTDKHNACASREAVDVLNLQHRFMPHDSVASLSSGQAGLKRWIKERVYARLPGGFRAFAYFFYRYVIRLGFLDGRVGTAFHVLQGFWYRYLVDAKIAEVERYMAREQCGVVEAIRAVLGIEVKMPAVEPLDSPRLGR